MDSLLANYASSDDEAEEEKEPKSSAPSKPTSISTGLPPPKSASLSIPPAKPSFFSSLPPPKSSTTSSSSSIFSSLPPPKSHQLNPSFDPPTSSLPKTHNQNNEDESNESKERKPIKDFPSSSIFSALPPPKSQPPNPKKAPPLDPNPKRVVQFTLPLNPSMLKSHDPDEEEDEERKPIKDFSNSTSSKALSSMLPAPKNSLCLAPTAASRRSTVDSEAKIPASNPEGFKREQERDNFENHVAYPLEQGVSGFENYVSHDGNWVMNGSSDPGFGNSYESDGGGYGIHVANWADGSVSMAASEVPDVRRIVGKRGRNEIPAEIVEVKQDELIKNRPREDQVKLTGIAFGPAYQPVSSSKGKPSKLHKRKHQIGSLYHDMKQKEMELAERRSKGLLTKAETQAKYGW